MKAAQRIGKQSILVTQSSMPPFRDYCRLIRPIWKRRRLTNSGPLHQTFRDQLQRFLKAPEVQLFVNGHQALLNGWKSLQAADAIPAAGEVITTPFTFASTVNAIVDAGLTPVFCDINEADFTLDADQIEPLITERTVAICGVHVYGFPCRVDSIAALARRHRLQVVYDAAHAFGVAVNGQGIAAYGDLSMFSFHATKVFHTIEGGCLAYSDAALTPFIEGYRNFGIVDDDIALCGSNAKMNEFQAAMGIANLRRVESEIAKRKAASDRYDFHLGNVEGLFVPKPRPGTLRNYAYYPVTVDPDRFGQSRDALCSRLNREGIYPRKYFYPAINETTAYRGRYSGTTPVASRVAERVLCLPLFADLSLKQVDRICRIVRQAKEQPAA